MRPLCVHMENFCSYREPTSIALHDVDYFVLVGPTGSGKSTVIDAICFALYGTVPRWGRENVISLALAPSATSGKVALVFEAAGRRYGVVRALARSARGAVTTREARLDELDPSADPATGIEELLAASVRTVADGDAVTAAAQRLTGLEYRFFTQSVILPQGRFAEFLQAKPSDRQDLLVQLLDAETFERIRKRAGDEEKIAAAEARAAQAQLDRLPHADEATETAAVARLEGLRTLRDEVRDALDELGAIETGMREAEAKAEESLRALGTLAALAMPPYVPTLTDDLRDAAEEAGRLADEAARREEAETRAHERLAGLGDKAELQLALRAHQNRARIEDELTGIRADARSARTAATEAAGAVERASALRREAEDAWRHARDAHAAAALAQRITVGEPCPVCAQTVTEPPRAEPTSALADAEANGRARAAELDAAQRRHRELDSAASRLEERVAALERQLRAEDDTVHAHPEAARVRARLAEIAAAEKEVDGARNAARRARAAAADAAKDHARLRDEADGARGELDRARDTVVAFGAPPLASADLHAAWTTLLTWRDQESARRRRSAEAIKADLDEARSRHAAGRDALGASLTEHGIPARDVVTGGAGPDEIRSRVQDARNKAEHHLERVRADRKAAARLRAEVREWEREAEIAHGLAQHLRANKFENWLCGEALSLLVETASQTLRELSDGQFELVLDDRNAIEVIDYAEAGMRRSVRTLSGGETFQASLALALALSDQVARFGGGAARSLESIFLDEGFGTLDPATLDTVAATLERLASGGDRVVGIVTHVPALAERVPVRFEVSRDGTGSHIGKRTA